MLLAAVLWVSVEEPYVCCTPSTSLGPPPLAPRWDDAAEVTTDAPEELAGATELPWLWLDAVDTTLRPRPSPSPRRVPSADAPAVACSGCAATGTGRCAADPAPDGRRSESWLWLADAGRGGSAYDCPCSAAEVTDGRRAELKKGEEGEGGSGAAGLTMAESMERERLGMSDIVEAGDPQAVRPTRGFGVGYETLPDEITSDIDVTRLVHDLKKSGVEVRFPSFSFFAPHLCVVLE